MKLSILRKMFLLIIFDEYVKLIFLLFNNKEYFIFHCIHFEIKNYQSNFFYLLFIDIYLI